MPSWLHSSSLHASASQHILLAEALPLKPLNIHAHLLLFARTSATKQRTAAPIQHTCWLCTKNSGHASKNTINTHTYDLLHLHVLLRQFSRKAVCWTPILALFHLCAKVESQLPQLSTASLPAAHTCNCLCDMTELGMVCTTVHLCAVQHQPLCNLAPCSNWHISAALKASCVPHPCRHKTVEHNCQPKYLPGAVLLQALCNRIGGVSSFCAVMQRQPRSRHCVCAPAAKQPCICSKHSLQGEF